MCLALPRRLGGLGQRTESHRQEQPDDAIRDDERSKDIGTRPPGSDELPTGEAAYEGSDRRCHGTDEVVPREDRSASLVGDSLRKRRLLDREEWSDFLV